MQMSNENEVIITANDYVITDIPLDNHFNDMTCYGGVLYSKDAKIFDRLILKYIEKQSEYYYVHSSAKRVIYSFESIIYNKKVTIEYEKAYSSGNKFTKAVESGEILPGYEIMIKAILSGFEWTKKHKGYHIQIDRIIKLESIIPN